MNIYTENSELIQEVNRLLALSRITEAAINNSKFKDHFLNIKQKYNTTSHRHTLYHVVNPVIPSCECGNSVNWNGNEYNRYCSSKCANKSEAVNQKKKSTCISRYGTEYPAQSSSVLEKMKNTNMERYGHVSASCLDSIKQIKKEKSIERYGVESPLCSEEIQAKTKNSMIERYGVDHPSKSNVIQERTKHTLIDRYGVDNAFKSSDVKQKIKQTVIERYGVDHPMKASAIIEKAAATYQRKKEHDGRYIEEINEKRRQTCLDRYGVIHPKQQHYTPAAIELLNDDQRFTELLANTSMFEIAKNFGISSYPIYQKMKELGIIKDIKASEFEKEVIAFLKNNYTGKIIQHDRTVIAPKEVDIYLPELKIAIECNGSYWHSELNGKSSAYHVSKTNDCLNKGIRLFHLWEHDWIKSKEIVQSMLSSRIQNTTKIYARSCEIRAVPYKEAGVFFAKNHLQGKCRASVYLGLYKNDELVSCMSFGNPRYNKKYQWELIRFATKLNFTVVGGASKLFKAFMQQYSPKTVISYANRSYSVGDLYRNLGFEWVKTTQPGYKYTENYLDFYDRTVFQKHRLLKKGLAFDPLLTEWENMQANGYDRVHDSGNDVFVWELQCEKR